MNNPIQLLQCPGRFCIAKLNPGADRAAVQDLQSYQGEFVSVTRTADEVSIICEQSNSNLQVLGPCEAIEKDWVGFRVDGTMDFELVGIIAQISVALADDQIPLFCLSTFDTDYVLVKSHYKQATLTAFSNHQITVKK